MKGLIKTKCLILIATLSILFCPTLTKAQTELETLLAKAEKAIQQYSETFKNLSAEETKIFEDFDKNGKVKETRVIKSTFIVYQSPRNDAINEYRNILEFNGKTVARDTEEIEKLFEKFAKADTNGEEWQKVRKEGIRFDGRSSAWGMTLWQDAPFGLLRPFFDYKIIGKENFAGREVILVAYSQSKPTLLVKFNPTNDDWKKEPKGRGYASDVPSGFLPVSPHLTGRMWLDSETGQIWRNEFKVVIEPALLNKSISALELSYEYQPSEFKILVPKKFQITSYKISGRSEKDLFISKDRTMTFEYSNFSEFNSEVKNYKLDNKQ